MIKIIKNITVFLGIIWILIFTVWLAFSAVLVINKDEIGRYFILHLNQIQSGELSVEQVSISPFRQFPHISVNLENVTYYEHRKNQRSETERPIARIENFYCGLQIIKLFKGEFKILKVNVNKGDLFILIYPDSTVNILNALKKDSTSGSKGSSEITKTEKNKTKTTTISSLSIEKFVINDLNLKLANDVDKRESSILIKNFESKFDY